MELWDREFIRKTESNLFLPFLCISFATVADLLFDVFFSTVESIKIEEEVALFFHIWTLVQ